MNSPHTHHHHASSVNDSLHSVAAGNKYAPARRLASRHTLRLAIPKYQCDSTFGSGYNGNTNGNGLSIHSTSGRYQPHVSPPQIQHPTSNYYRSSANGLHHHGKPPSAPIITMNGIQKTSPIRDLATATCNSMNGKFLGVRKPSITLSSADATNNNEMFAFAKDCSPVDHLSEDSPIFSELASSISPSTSSSSPTFNRLFSLSPSSIRSYALDNMSDFSDSTQHVSPAAASLIENFHKKNGTIGPSSASAAISVGNGGIGGSGGSSTPTSLTGGTTGSLSALSSNTRQNLINTSSSSSSSLKETSSTSQQVVNSSSTTTRVEKKSQRLHQVTSSSSSSSSSSTSEMKATALKRDLSEIKNSMSEINDLAMSCTATQKLNDLKMNSSATLDQIQKKIRSSIENLVDSPSGEPLVTFPDSEDDHHDLKMDLVGASKNALTNGLSGSSKTVDTVKFEEKRTKTESKTKVITDGFSSEQATSNMALSKRLQAGDIDYKEAKAASAMRNRLEVDGVKTEENAAVVQEALSLRTGDVTQQSFNNVAAASIKVQSDNFSAERKAISQEQKSQTMTTNGGIINQEKQVSSASQSNYTITTRGVSSSATNTISSSSQMSSNGHHIRLDVKFDDLKSLTSGSSLRDIENAKSKYSTFLKNFVNSLHETNPHEKPVYLDTINKVIQNAWAVPTHGHELGYSLCNSLRVSGGLDMLMENCEQNDQAVQFSSARLLEQCLTTENRTHVVDNGLDKVVKVACVCTKNTDTQHSRVGTGILEHLFKHSEGTCYDVIRLGGLDAVLFECRTNDVETLRHCASALANLSLYGGAENQEAMINRKVPMWLFPLAFHHDDNIKYYACLAIAVLVANKEIEAEVLKSGTLDLVEPFVTSHDPSEFAKSNLAHAHGQSKHWLERLVPVLSSNREEARNLAAFHFCMEAGIKKEQGNTEIFREIGAIEPLKTVASCPNAIASKFAAQALRLIGETVPHKLSQQVPLWSVEDVQEWVKQIGFAAFERQFAESQVDGDLLLKLNEENLREDIGISNGILRKRFARELQNLKKMADYSSKDCAKMCQFLNEIGPEYCTYTYAMLNAGIDKSSLRQLNEDMLLADCGIQNSIHRFRILNAVKSLENSLQSVSEENMAKTLDVFVSYRRSNGSQLASLLKVHLQLRGFSVFIDVERLEAGKFDNGLLNSIKQAKHFILVLTPNALERCVEDYEGKDWVHREIVAALNSNCNIIPIIDNFRWPEAEMLPEDMRSVCHFNGVTWIHDYQDACIDKLERFMRGEKNPDRIGMAPSTPGSASVNYQRMHSNDSDYQTGVSSCGGSTVGTNGGCSAGSGNSNGSGSCQGTNGGQANHPANRYRKSSSPGRTYFGGNGHHGGSGVISGAGSIGGIGPYGGRGGSKRNLLFPPYRTSPISARTVNGNASNTGYNGSGTSVPVSPYRSGRRSSAVAITNASPHSPTPSFRSHSLGGLLDGGSGDDETVGANGSNAEDTPIEASCDSVVLKRDKSNTMLNTQNRKSRSLDQLLDDFPLTVPGITEGTQSMHNLATPGTPELNGCLEHTESSSPSSPQPSKTLAKQSSSTRDSQSVTPERTVSRQSPEGISSAEDDREDTQSNYSTGSKDTGKSSNSQKTLFNRTLKKVRSLMKKP
ncbi:NAD(+) hydrolase sarm1 isoform X2 [Eupeodes corollae]|uniref:NAD(+) hydrolase sarm1 isoform X2 n=1 Tax=Eupeodes corollae TaxID=290404 RepID=UPI002490A092|nr:NAD(+) hydrolase sarm1 isoform X2 [Eupeodes corollae]